MDFFRQIALYKSKLLIIEAEGISPNEKSIVLLSRNFIVWIIAYFFKMSFYETWALINS